MIFHYKAINKEGGLVTGNIDLANDRSAARQLQRQGLTLVELTEAAAKPSKTTGRSTKA